MKLDAMVALTQELIDARGPVGQEDEVRAIVQREMKALCDEVRTDDAGNVIGQLRGGGKNAKKAVPTIKIMAHMDELSLIVKRVEADGTLRVRALGGIFPWVFGLGPVEILGDKRTLPGVLGAGCMHTTHETPDAYRSKGQGRAGEAKTPEWDQIHVFTRLTPKELDAAGVHPGTRVVIPADVRKLRAIGDCLCGYFLDDRVCIAIMLAAASLLKAKKKRPAGDVYLVGTCQEEIGGGSAAYAARTVPGTVTLAIDVAPVAKEYGTELTDQPIVAYRDRNTVYDRSIADALVAAGRKQRLRPQHVMLESYGSDASASKVAGNTARAGLLCIPTEFTHGYEIVVKRGIENCAKLLAQYLENPQ